MQARSLLSQTALSLMLVCLTPTIILAAPLFEATYKGEYANLNITMTRTLSRNGNDYHLTSKAKSFMAKINESSDFSLTKNTLRPHRYLYERKIFGVKKKEQLTFDWGSLVANYTKGNDPEGAQPLNKNSLDPTLYQLQLQRDIAQNPDQKTFNYTFVRRNQTKQYHFKRSDNAGLTFKGKQYSAIVVIRTGDGDKETKLWLIPELNYTLAKIRHTDEDGDTNEVLLTNYSSTDAFKQFLQAAPFIQ